MTTILATVMTLLAMCMAAPEVAAEEETKLLTVEDCVQISDTQIIVKFSEPIAVKMCIRDSGPETPEGPGGADRGQEPYRRAGGPGRGGKRLCGRAHKTPGGRAGRAG